MSGLKDSIGYILIVIIICYLVYLGIRIHYINSQTNTLQKTNHVHEKGIDVIEENVRHVLNPRDSATKLHHRTLNVMHNLKNTIQKANEEQEHAQWLQSQTRTALDANLDYNFIHLNNRLVSEENKRKLHDDYIVNLMTNASDAHQYFLDDMRYKMNDQHLSTQSNITHSHHMFNRYHTAQSNYILGSISGFENKIDREVNIIKQDITNKLNTLSEDSDKNINKLYQGVENAQILAAKKLRATECNAAIYENRNLTQLHLTYSNYAIQNNKWNDNTVSWMDMFNTNMASLCNLMSYNTKLISQHKLSTAKKFTELNAKDEVLQAELNMMQKNAEYKLKALSNAMYSKDVDLTQHIAGINDIVHVMTNQLDIGGSAIAKTTNDIFHVTVPRMDISNHEGKILQSINNHIWTASNDSRDYKSTQLTTSSIDLSKGACISNPKVNGKVCYNDQGLVLKDRVHLDDEGIIGGTILGTNDVGLSIGANTLHVNNLAATNVSTPTSADALFGSMTINTLSTPGSIRSSNITLRNELQARNVFTNSINNSLTRENNHLRLNACEGVHVTCGDVGTRFDGMNGALTADENMNTMTMQSTIKHTTHDMLTSSNLLIGSDILRIPSKLKVSAPIENDWQVRQTNGTTSIYANHGAGYGMHINTTDTDTNKYSVQVSNGQEHVFNIWNDGRIQVSDKLCMGGQCFDAKNIKRLATLSYDHVHLFKGKHYTGQRLTVPVNTYLTAEELINQGFHDNIQSIWIAPGADLKVMLYQYSDRNNNMREGVAQVVTESIPVLFNDVSEIEVYRKDDARTIPTPAPLDCKMEWGEWSQCSRSCGGGVQTRNQYIAQTPSNGGKACMAVQKETRPCNTQKCDTMVTIYQHCDYTGWSVTLGPGRYTLWNLRAKGFRNNDASSMIIRNPGKVTLFEFDNFQGRGLQSKQDIPCFIPYGFNNIVSSIIVE